MLSSLQTSCHSQDDDLAEESERKRTEELVSHVHSLADAVVLLQEEICKHQDTLDDDEDTASEADMQVSFSVKSFVAVSNMRRKRDKLAAAGLMAAAGAGMIIGAPVPTVALIAATTLAGTGAAVTMAAKSGGIACHASVKEGRTRSGIEVSEVRAVIMVEKGVGRCYYFAYASEEEAMYHMDASFAKLTSRILFAYQWGSLQEVRSKGLPFAANTIRKAAASLERVLQHSKKDW